MNIVPACETVGHGSVRAELGTFRIAVMSTPRSGNTWLRRLLDMVYSLPQVVADTPDDVAWDQLPQQCILQLHWPADVELVSQLASHDFKVVTLFRHPCDTLISILHFATVWESTSLWMGGTGGDESSIVGARPVSQEFIDYSASDRAKLLIAASADWAKTQDSHAVGYEALVQDTASELKRLTDALLPTTTEVIGAAVEANSLTRMRATVQNQHCWRGQPGIWKTLLPQSAAQAIASHHADAFGTMGYDTDADQNLTTLQADANWANLELATLRQEMVQSRTQLKQAVDELNKAKWKVCDLEENLKETTRRFGPLMDLSPSIISLSKQVNRVARRFRKAKAFTKRHLGRQQDQSRAA